MLSDIPVENRVIGYKMMYMRNVGMAKNRRQKLGLMRNNTLDRNSDVRRIAIVAMIVCPAMINRDWSQIPAIKGRVSVAMLMPKITREILLPTSNVVMNCR